MVVILVAVPLPVRRGGVEDVQGAVAEAGLAEGGDVRLWKARTIQQVITWHIKDQKGQPTAVKETP